MGLIFSKHSRTKGSLRSQGSDTKIEKRHKRQHTSRDENRTFDPNCYAFAAIIAGLLTASALTDSHANGQSYMAVYAGAFHTCALLDEGKAKCWGDNGDGQLGYGDTQNRGDNPGEMGANLPFVDLGDDVLISQLAAGSYHSCALLNTQKVKCWGRNNFGQLGLGSNEDVGDSPNEMGNKLPIVDLGPDYKAVMISAGSFYTCALLDDGTVKCWGRNEYGQLGIGNRTTIGTDSAHMGDNLAKADFGNVTIIDVSAGGQFTCILTESHQVKCVGRNNLGSLGTGDSANYGSDPQTIGDAIPFVDLGPNIEVVKISSGYYDTCALTTQDKIKCWGDNRFGSLGLGDTTVRGTTPNSMGSALPFVNPFGGGWVVDISIGSLYTCAISAWGTLKCWGRNFNGQLGLGDNEDRGDSTGESGENLPTTQTPVLSTIEQVTIGNAHTCILSNGNVRCFGSNFRGQLGYGHRNDLGRTMETIPAVLPAVDL